MSTTLQAVLASAVGVVGLAFVAVMIALIARTPRRGATADAAAERLDEVMPAAPSSPAVMHDPKRAPQAVYRDQLPRNVDEIHAELLRLQAEMTRRALADDWRPSGGPAAVVVVDGRGGRDTYRAPAEELSAFEDPPALPVSRGRDDRGNAGLGFLVCFVAVLLIFGYVWEHGADESMDTVNRCGRQGARGFFHADFSKVDCLDNRDGRRPDVRRWGSTSAAELRAALGRVEVVDGRPEVDGYDRAEFGPDWTDEYEGPAGGNDCDTRNDVLAAQMRHVRREDGCVVAAGTLADPYTGRTIRFDQDADPSAVQIDHVVPLSVAWDMGASQWSEDKRTVFANDAARNLVASDGPANMSKGDQPPAEWLPPNAAARCEYLRRYLVVSDHYGLPVTEADAAVVREQAPRCASGDHGGRPR